MHIRENDLLVEIVNPRTKESLKEGEIGEVLITTLSRKAMPLIRYATGDISSITTGNCPCKSILKRLNKIEYRINDRVYLGKNLYININMIDNILFKLKDLINYKIEIENNHNFYELNLQLAFLHLNNENMSYAYNNKLKNKIKDLLLSNSTIEKSFEMGNLKFNIKLIYTKEYINFYKGKRKIIFN